MASSWTRAETYAERLFVFSNIGPLDTDAATAALAHPIEAEDCSIAPDAVARILQLTEGYPYFLQE